MNKVVLLGRLCVEPELKKVKIGESDVSMTSFTIAVPRNYKRGEDRESDFINVVAWRKTAEIICKYFSKGQRISLAGSLRSSSYTDKNGNKKYQLNVSADEVEFIEKAEKADNVSHQDKLATGNTTEYDVPTNMPVSLADIEQMAMAELNDDDLPF